MKGLVVVNPNAGAGKGLSIGARVRTYFLKSKDEFYFVEATSRAESLAQVDALCRTYKFKVLISIGGDGLIHDLLPTLIKYQIPLLVIPAGTGNDLARSLGLYKVTLQQLLELPFNTKPITLDLALVTHLGGTTPFIQILSTGFDSVVNERANNFRSIRGKIKYIAAVFLEVWRFRALKFTVTIDGVTQEHDAMMVCVANGSSYGGGMKIIPHARRDDQLLHVMVVDRVNPLRLLLVFPRVFFGTHVHHPKVHFYSGKKVHVSGKAKAFADGER
ncbi:MAG TPA: diacylglycerol kinase family protein, partial [Candidatus Nanopelagicaceae bacterium]